MHVTLIFRPDPSKINLTRTERFLDLGKSVRSG